MENGEEWETCGGLGVKHDETSTKRWCQNSMESKYLELSGVFENSLKMAETFK